MTGTYGRPGPIGSADTAVRRECTDRRPLSNGWCRSRRCKGDHQDGDTAAGPGGSQRPAARSRGPARRHGPQPVPSPPITHPAGAVFSTVRSPNAAAVSARVVLAADDLVTARWAAAEAERLHAALQVVGTGDDIARARVTRVLRASFPGAAVTSRRVADPLGADLSRVGASAELMVVAAVSGSRVVGDAVCPVATVPPTVPPVGRVIVGVAPWTAPCVLDVAVREAVARGAELVAVRAWAGPDSDLGRILPDTLMRWDRGLERARRELQRSVDRWRTEETGGRFRLLTVRDDAAPLLIALSTDAELLVLGRSSRGTASGTVASIPVGDLVAAVRCPVIVVPEPATPLDASASERARSGS